MKNRSYMYVQCQKCLKKLSMKKEKFIETPYCEHCEVEFMITISTKDEIKITVTEKE